MTHLLLATDDLVPGSVLPGRLQWPVDVVAAAVVAGAVRRAQPR